MEGVREYLGILRLKVNNGVRKRSVHCQGGQYVLPCRMCLSLAGGCGSVRSSNTQRTVLCNQTLCWGQGWFWVHRVQQWKDAALQPSQLPTAAAVAEGQHKAKGLGEGEYTSYLQEIWSQVAFLFPFSGATTFVHAWDNVNKVCLWEGKCRTERHSKRMKPVQLNCAVCGCVFSAYGGQLLASDGFCRAWCASALELAVAWVEFVSAGEANVDTQLPSDNI